MEYLKIVGTRVRRMRLEKGFTQVELAAKIPMGELQLSRIENGRSGTTIKVYEKIAEALGISPGRLLGENDHEIDHAD